MKKIFIVMVLLVFAYGTAVFAQPAPRSLYLAEVRQTFPVRAAPGVYMGTSYRLMRVWAPDEFSAEMRARETATGSNIRNHTFRFVRWIPQAEYTASEMAYFAHRHRDRGNYNATITAANRAIQLFGNNVPRRYLGLFSTRAYAHMRLGNFAQARADADHVLRIDPHNSPRATRISEELRRRGH